MALTKESFFNNNGFSESAFNSTGLLWEDLVSIKDDYENKRESYEETLSEFMNSFIVCQHENGLHSYSSRTKDPEHLIAKIVRKLIDDKSNREVNYPKYKNISINNYEYLVTDLIGVKGLILYREDWYKFHDFLLKIFPEEKNIYGKPLDAKLFNSAPAQCMIEAPKVHLRKGDDGEIYILRVPIENIDDSKYYRSIHYILKFKNNIIEIQIRTLFDEGWGEVDHNLLYPKHIKNKFLTEYSELLTRLTGMANEMSSFFRRTVELDTSQFQSKETMNSSVQKSFSVPPSPVVNAEQDSKIETNCENLRMGVIKQ